MCMINILERNSGVKLNNFINVTHIALRILTCLATKAEIDTFFDKKVLLQNFILPLTNLQENCNI